MKWGAATLVDELDKKLLVVLRDGRNLVGTLRSFDQFANLVLEETLERIFVGQQYGEVPLGLYVVRGENVVLAGRLDSNRDEVPKSVAKVSSEEILKAQKAEKQSKDLKGSMLKRFDFTFLDDM